MITGIVQKISQKDTAVGVMYNAQINGQWYGYGSKVPNFKEGDSISFDVQTKGQYSNIIAKTVEINAKPTNVVAAVPAASGNSKDEYWSNKEAKDLGVQRAIQQQSARNAAIAFVIPLAVAGVIKLPAKAEDKFSAVASLVDEFTDRYYLATQDAVLGEYTPEENNVVPFDMAAGDN